MRKIVCVKERNQRLYNLSLFDSGGHSKIVSHGTISIVLTSLNQKDKSSNLNQANTNKNPT